MRSSESYISPEADFMNPVLCHCCSVTKSCLTLCDPNGQQYARPLCPPLSPGVCSNTCSLSQWCHPIISSSAALVPALSLSQHQGLSNESAFASGGQSIGVSAVTSILPMNIQGWFPCCLRDSRIFSITTVQKHKFFSVHPSLWSNSHTHT